MTTVRKRAGIKGVGVALPDKVVTNSDLEKIVETSDEWIRIRTGIKERRIVDDDTAASDIGAQAGLDALKNADVNPEDVDLIITATVTPDMFFPSTGCVIQRKMGIHDSPAFDISAGCSGFVYALSIASAYIEAGIYENILVIGTETLSKILDWTDRSTCVIFGDGAGAVLLQPVEEGGILSTHIGADGRGDNLLEVPAGGSRIPITEDVLNKRLQYIKMAGNEVFKFAVRVMEEASVAALKKAGLTTKDVNILIPHQANIRIIKAAARRLYLPEESIITNLDKYGNTSAASIPIALCEAFHSGKISKGDIVVLVGFGAGLTWGASVVKWSKE